MTANYNLSKMLINERRKEESALRTINFLNKLKKRPVASFAIFALILVVIQLLAKNDMISSSFATAIGSTIIFCIVGLGFCLLPGIGADLV